METPQASKWATRFVFAAVIQGLLAVVLTAYLLYQAVFGTPAASRIVAGGGAGTWLNMGYLGYLIMGVGVTAIMAFFYQYLEVRLNKKFGKWTGALAWGSLVLWNVGVVGATWLMMHAGYSGGGAAIATQFGGLGYNAGQIHEIMIAYPGWIAGFFAVALLGAFLGIVGYLTAWAAPAKLQRKARVPAPQ